jgi:hypothetical protein
MSASALELSLGGARIRPVLACSIGYLIEVGRCERCNTRVMRDSYSEITAQSSTVPAFRQAPSLPTPSTRLRRPRSPFVARWFVDGNRRRRCLFLLDGLGLWHRALFSRLSHTT